MNWKTSGRTFERQRQTTNLPGYLHSLNQYGVQTRFHSDDLSVTATAMNTNGSFQEQPRRPLLKLSNSDNKVMSIMRQPAIMQDTRGIRRGRTLEEIGGLKKLSESLPPLSSNSNRKISVNILPPIVTRKENESEIDQESAVEGIMSTLDDEDSIIQDDGSCSSSDGEVYQ